MVCLEVKIRHGFVLVARFCVWLIDVFKSIGRLIFHMEEKITIESFSILNLSVRFSLLPISGRQVCFGMVVFCKLK